MCRLIYSLPLALLFLANVLPLNAQSDVTTPPATAGPVVSVDPVSLAAPVDPSAILVYYDVKLNLSLTCPLAPQKDAPYKWKKNGTDIEAVDNLKGRYDLQNGSAVLAIKDRSREEDYGPYTCSVGDKTQTFDVRGRTRLTLPPDTNVVEKQNLKMQCKATGKPYPASVIWLYSASGDPNASVEVTSVFGDRVNLSTSEQNVPGAELLLKEARREDAGRYECKVAALDPGAVGHPGVTTLRVKDMYAALWPFLGICAEVFILCAIILVYEKRRTKPELDDSDTDNHDQKKS